MNNDHTMLTARQAAELLGISRRAFYEIQQMIKGRDGGRRRWRWPHSEVIAFMNSCRTFAGAFTGIERGQRIANGKYGLLPDHDLLLTANAIAANKARFPYSGPAVYFLFQGDDLVYIGKAVNLLRRVAGHFGQKNFDHFSYIVCKREELETLERSAIVKFQPKLNRV